MTLNLKKKKESQEVVVFKVFKSKKPMKVSGTLKKKNRKMTPQYRREVTSRGLKRNSLASHWALLPVSLCELTVTGSLQVKAITSARNLGNSPS